MPDSSVGRKIISISVDLGITTPDGLRHIDFGLAKETGDDDVITWTIDFAFQTRESKDEDFVDEVKLKIKIKSTDFAKAEQTATDGLTEPQVTHLNGPVTAISQQRSKGKATDAQVTKVAAKTISLH
jgi:hypothetical protein